MLPDRRVTILHDDRNAAVEEVAAVLGDSGMQVAIFRVKDDLDALAAGVRASRPDLLFNLVGRATQNPRLAPDIAAALDLLGYPYTGAGPPGLYLAGDVHLTRRLLASYGIAATGDGPRVRVGVVGNERPQAMGFGTGDAASITLASAFTALRLRDYALVELQLDDGGAPAVVSAVPNPPLERDGELARLSADTGRGYDELILSIADEAWLRHNDLAAIVKTA
jgi:hypothetical protein